MNRLKVARSAVTVSVVLWIVLGVSGASAKVRAEQQVPSSLSASTWPSAGCGAKRSSASSRRDSSHPGSVSILNNLAICYEAGGRFEEALETYREALRLAPENRVVKQNYSRFAEFYQGYRPRKATAAGHRAGARAAAGRLSSASPGARRAAGGSRRPLPTAAARGGPAALTPGGFSGARLVPAEVEIDCDPKPPTGSPGSGPLSRSRSSVRW